MIRVLLLSMRKELTLSAWKHLQMLESWHLEELKREIWRELFLLVEELLSTLSKNLQRLILDMLILLKSMFWDKKNTHLFLE